MTDAEPDPIDLSAGLRQHHAWEEPEHAEARQRARERVLRDRFEHEVDPDGVLDEGERMVRARHARLAHYARLSLRSSRQRKGG